MRILIFLAFVVGIALSLDDDSMCSRGKLERPWVAKSSASTRLVQNTNCSRPLVEGERMDCSRGVGGNVPIITYAMLYYKDSTFLEEQEKNWCSWPLATRQKFQFLIVDDGSPAGESAIQKYVHNGCINLLIYTIEKDLKWNIGGARNLAFHVAPTDYVFLLDSDILVPPTIALACLKMVQNEYSSASKQMSNNTRTSESVFYNFNRNSKGVRLHPHPAAMMLTKKAYWMCGGCDEDFVGNYGQTDPHFKWRAGLTKGIKMRKVNEMYDDELVMMGDGLMPDRPTHLNRQMFKAKMFGNMTWSNDYIRFPWRFNAQFCIKEQ